MHQSVVWRAAALLVAAGVLFVPLGASSAVSAASPTSVTVTGELKKWHWVTLTFDGPQVSESDAVNPFLNYRLTVTFTNNGRNVVVPGFFAADGNAAESSATSGDKWRVHFTPDEQGIWTYTASFRYGTNVAVSTDPSAGSPVSFDGAAGSFRIGPTDKTGRDHRAKGTLRYVGKHFLRFAETGEYYIKGGADSPENFLAYEEFDDTYDSVYFLTYNIDCGDGKETCGRGLASASGTDTTAASSTSGRSFSRTWTSSEYSFI